MNRYLLVLGPYGSGSTAVAGVLDRLGAYTCPPYHHTNDPRTPNSYEPKVLRDILRKHINEGGLLRTGDMVELGNEVKRWLDETVPAAEGEQVVALKHALLGMALPIFWSLLKPQIIVVRRSYVDIERTRMRRQWAPVLGYFGARILYERMYSDLTGQNMNFLDLYYPDLLAHPEREVARIAEFAGLDADGSRREEALSFIRR